MTPYVTVVFARPHPYLTVQLAEQPRDKNGRWAPQDWKGGKAGKAAGGSPADAARAAREAKAFAVAHGRKGGKLDDAAITAHAAKLGPVGSKARDSFDVYVTNNRQQMRDVAYAAGVTAGWSKTKEAMIESAVGRVVVENVLSGGKLNGASLEAAAAKLGPAYVTGMTDLRSWAVLNTAKLRDMRAEANKTVKAAETAAGRATNPVRPLPPGWEAPRVGEAPPVPGPEGWTFAGTRKIGSLKEGDLHHVDSIYTGMLLSSPAVRFTKENADGRELAVEIYGGSIGSLFGMAQTASMFERMTVHQPSDGGEMVLQFSPLNPQVGGYARVGSGQITVGTQMLTQTAPSVRDQGADARLVRSENLSPLQGVVVHEWGHASGDTRGAGETGVFDGKAPKPVATRLADRMGIKTGDGATTPWTMENTRRAIVYEAKKVGPLASEYAKVSADEAVAEAYVDWIGNGGNALPSSKVVAELYGWEPYDWQQP